MRRLLLLLITVSYATYAEEPVQPVLPMTTSSPRITATRDLWRVSMTTLAVANVMDVHSSWGKHELNSALASSNGTFGTKGALVKLGIQGGMMAVEYIITRGHPSGKLYRALAVVNFGASAGISAVAMHNYSIPRH